MGLSRSRTYVSVPLRGKGRDQRITVSPREETERVMFPSPCGEKVGINILPATNYFDILNAFPSPCGEKVGINTLAGTAFRPPARPGGFRPLAGKR